MGTPVNCWPAGSGLGLLAIILDMLKGAIPALAHYVFKVDSWPLMPVALSPILGTRVLAASWWRGGKALASASGIWTAMTVPFGPFVGDSVSLRWKRASASILLFASVLPGFAGRQHRAWRNRASNLCPRDDR